MLIILLVAQKKLNKQGVHCDCVGTLPSIAKRHTLKSSKPALKYPWWNDNVVAHHFTKNRKSWRLLVHIQVIRALKSRDNIPLRASNCLSKIFFKEDVLPEVLASIKLRNIINSCKKCVVNIFTVVRYTF